MNDTIKMQISAFIDGELPDNESELLLRRLCQDAELRRVVARYIEIGHSMQNKVEVPKMAQLRHRIAGELGTEPHVEEAAPVPLHNRYLKPFAGLAIAASVAVMAIFGLQQANIPDAEVEAVAESGAYTQPPLADERLDEMFRLHENAFGNAGSNAILSEFAAFEINEENLVEVEPRAKLVAPVEIDGETEEEDAASGIDADTTEQLKD
jgi:negative regulator of sigma E activity